MSTERPWLSNYPSGVPANINPEQYPNINAFLKEALSKHKSRKAFACMGKEISYGQVDKMSLQLAAYLQSRGLEPGDRMAVMMPNLLQYPIASFACLRAGLICVNTNPLYTPKEMLHQFRDSGVRGIIIAENFASKLEEILDQTQIKVVITTSIGELLGFFRSAMTDFVVRKVKRMVPKYNISNTIRFSEAVKLGRKFTVKSFEDGPDRVVVHQYTGGTTGISKGAMLTNRNLLANVMQIKAVLLTNFEDGKEVVLCPLPLYHILAFTVHCLGMMQTGALNVLITNPRDQGSIIKEFKRYPITLMLGVNTLYNALLNHKDFANCDFSKMRIVVAGGMALLNPVAEKWKEVTGCPITQGYGLTETSPVASVNPIDGSGKLGSIGMPVSSTDMRVVDENGSVLGANEVGEIQIKGPQVMKGYYNQPAETDNVIKDGWLRTGDIGKMDEDGYFFIVDRKKDMILVSGFNVYPNEVEEHVVAHPKVLEVAAIGIPDERCGEVVKLFIVKKDKSLTKEEVINYCREGLTGYKVPREVEFRKSLPKTNIGKILRRALRDEEEK